MNQGTGPDQPDPAAVAEVAQEAHSTAHTRTNAAPVRGTRGKGAIKRQSGSERLLGVEDSKPEPTERPARRKPSPKPQPRPAAQPVTYLLEDGGAWDDEKTPIGHALAVELSGGAK